MVRIWERNHQEKRILGARMLVEKLDCHVGDISRGVKFLGQACPPGLGRFITIVRVAVVSATERISIGAPFKQPSLVVTGNLVRVIGTNSCKVKSVIRR